MDDADIALRNLTYRMFVEVGSAPTVAQVAARAGMTVDAAGAGWRRLHASHAIVLDEGDDTLVFHCLVPASQWWDDIVFT
jgi:hypothetical protein